MADVPPPYNESKAPPPGPGYPPAGYAPVPNQPPGGGYYPPPPPANAPPYQQGPQYYPPPQPGQAPYPAYPGYPQGGNTTVVITQPGQIITTGIIFRGTPVACTCPHCRAQIVTSVSYETGVLPWLLCGGLILFGCTLGCCLIPFCIDDLKDATHSCPNCKQTIGHYRRM